ncbi:restriction endonuclease subunit S [Bosea sp. AK1]|uniref:restriction endonuclease subunit S n=1 Tax=Bosea sp. AK1 TaxID=2587160 RepID=UPI0016397F14|nr:restriction endonuclease subunit S [Bosea sp. AK1]
MNDHVSYPDEWQATKLADIAVIATGGTPPTQNEKLYGREHPFISPGDIGFSKFISKSEKMLSDLGWRGCKKFPTGTILFVCIGSTIGKIGVAARPVSANQQINGVVPLEKVVPDFLYYRLSLASREVKAQASEQAVPIINKTAFGELDLCLPPLREQKAIAEALSDADALREGLERLIAKKRLIKQGAMQDLLTAKRRLPGFWGEWEPRKLGNISAFITKGATPTTYGFSWQNHGVLFLRSECVSAKGLDLSQSMFISEEAHRATKRSEVSSGDILITITGNVGRVVRLPENFGVANINQHIARIRISAANSDRDFVFHQLSRPEYLRRFNSIVTGQAYPQISLEQVREATVNFPVLEEQVAIASILNDMDAEIQALEARLEKARQVKEGMMQNLLTGRIRLV